MGSGAALQLNPSPRGPDSPAPPYPLGAQDRNHNRLHSSRSSHTSRFSPGPACPQGLCTMDFEPQYPAFSPSSPNFPAPGEGGSICNFATLRRHPGGPVGAAPRLVRGAGLSPRSSLPTQAACPDCGTLTTRISSCQRQTESPLGTSRSGLGSRVGRTALSEDTSTRRGREVSHRAVTPPERPPNIAEGTGTPTTDRRPCCRLHHDGPGRQRSPGVLSGH